MPQPGPFPGNGGYKEAVLPTRLPDPSANNDATSEAFDFPWSETSFVSDPKVHVEAMMMAMTQEWESFQDRLDEATRRQKSFQEDIVNKCLERLDIMAGNAASASGGTQSREPQPTSEIRLAVAEYDGARAPAGRVKEAHYRSRAPDPFDTFNTLESQATFNTMGSQASRPEASVEPGGQEKKMKQEKLREPGKGNSNKTTIQDMIDSTAHWSGERSLFPRRCRSCLKRLALYLNLTEEADQTGCMADLVNSRRFETLCACVILTNAMFSWYSINEEVRTLNTDPPLAIKVIEILFVAFYTVEFVLKLLVFRMNYFLNSEWSWNLFDAALVSVSLIDQVLTLALSMEGQKADKGADFTFMRTLRILRVARVLRGLRVMRFFNELRLMLNSLIGSVSSLFWSIMMLGLIFYIFGLVFVQGAAGFLIERHNDGVDVVVTYPRLYSEFGTVEGAILALYKAATGGEDWYVFLDDLGPTGRGYVGLFVFFIAFSQIALLNILTAIFVQRALKLAQPDRETQAMEKRTNDMSEIEELRRILTDSDPDGNGILDHEEFVGLIKKGKLGAQLSILGLTIGDAHQFFNLIAKSDEIEIDDFVERCVHMRGTATSIEMHLLNRQIAHAYKINQDFQEDMLEKLAALQHPARRRIIGPPPPSSGASAIASPRSPGSTHGVRNKRRGP